MLEQEVLLEGEVHKVPIVLLCLVIGLILTAELYVGFQHVGGLQHTVQVSFGLDTSTNLHLCLDKFANRHRTFIAIDIGKDFIVFVTEGVVDPPYFILTDSAVKTCQGQCGSIEGDFVDRNIDGDNVGEVVGLGNRCRSNGDIAVAILIVVGTDNDVTAIVTILTTRTVGNLLGVDDLLVGDAMLCANDIAFLVENFNVLLLLNLIAIDEEKGLLATVHNTIVGDTLIAQRAFARGEFYLALAQVHTLQLH